MAFTLGRFFPCKLCMMIIVWVSPQNELTFNLILRCQSFMFQRTCACVSYESSLHRFSLHATHLGQIQQKLDWHCGSTTETYAWTQNYSLSRVVEEWVCMWWLCSTSSMQGPKMKWEVDVYACAVIFCFTSVINALSCVTQIFFFVCVCVYWGGGGGGGETLILGLWKERGGVILILTVQSRCSSVGTVCRASVCMDFDFKHCYGEYFQVWEL